MLHPSVDIIVVVVVVTHAFFNLNFLNALYTGKRSIL
uniref:Uncharacterized protein n=1 Tax=Anguilla anguilla TaxID=7936 RepID=A0A0E9QLT5_ANGAN